MEGKEELLQDLSRRFQRMVEEDPSILEPKPSPEEIARNEEIKETERINRALANQPAFEEKILDEVNEINRLVFDSKAKISGWTDEKEETLDHPIDPNDPTRMKIINKRSLSFGIDGTGIDEKIIIDISTNNFSNSKMGPEHHTMVATLKKWGDFEESRPYDEMDFRLRLGVGDVKNEVEAIMNVVRGNLDHSIRK